MRSGAGRPGATSSTASGTIVHMLIRPSDVYIRTAYMFCTQKPYNVSYHDVDMNAGYQRPFIVHTGIYRRNLNFGTINMGKEANYYPAGESAGGSPRGNSSYATSLS